MKHAFIFAGERSGDLHGSQLVRAFKEYDPEMIFEGVAGPKMRQEQVRSLLPMEEFEVMGLSDVVLAFARLFRHFRFIRRYILAKSPPLVILIDYPGFNLRLAAALRKGGFKGKIVQYISPTVWAHGRKRIVQMEKTLDLLLTIYPFETTYFDNTSLSVAYIGNPLSEYIFNYSYKKNWRKEFGIPQNCPIISLFPGSRAGEIARTLPILLSSAALIKKSHPEVIFGISCVDPNLIDAIKTAKMQKDFLKNALFPIPKEYTYELMQESKAAAAKSGTVTLELALHKCPTVAVYKLTFLNKLYAKYILKLNLPYYCIVNILAQKEVFPEIIKENLTAENLAFHLTNLYRNTSQRQDCLQACISLSSHLKEKSASCQAAKAIMEL